MPLVRHDTIVPVTPDIDAWDAWSPRQVAARLAGIDLPWCVAAGWALDLFRGGQTRPHGDLEFTVPAARWPDVAARFGELDFWVPCDGVVHPATERTLREEHQTWAWEPSVGRWRFDVFREPHEGDVWICRRDPRIRMPFADLVEHDADGIPYLAPEIALLFKAKARRDKDEADFAGVLPLLDTRRRAWLDDALALVHPDHPWRAALSRPSR
ncbi:hypothetical protein GCM10009557_49180 [Virgisporangium ochraceum]|uniref:Amino acid transporter n=1 Tax=Virgisporangium ochraceum TaxID=65505 RepID=A0A8J4E9G6_9ACTN|nr:hypothetical protein Voc01_016330 [Virgisporangium ochraceum]